MCKCFSDWHRADVPVIREMLVLSNHYYILHIMDSPTFPPLYQGVNKLQYVPLCDFVNKQLIVTWLCMLTYVLPWLLSA
jgi:hypothetical protein